METYENARPYFRDRAMIENIRNRSRYGVRDFFIELVNKAFQANCVSRLIRDGKWKGRYEDE